jgi:alpha-D-xyloside xylohydrolase
MKINLLFCVAISLLLFGSCSRDGDHDEQSAKVYKAADGVVVEINNPGESTKRVRLKVISEDIIRVSATPADSFSTEESLMVLPAAQTDVSWSLVETDTIVVLSTSSLRARIHRATGEVVFTDTLGVVLLNEQNGGGKAFIPKPIADKQYYTVQQKFLSPPDEAFYGLGGHQNGQMNYKGEDVELVQANIVDVVPLVVSNKNYGILWDNYSSSRFGDPRDYQPLNTLALFDKDGKPGGLSASYYVKDKVVKDTVEGVINFEFLETPQIDNFPKDVAGNGKVIWEGSFTSDQAGAHKFLIYSSGYCKVWVDGKLLVDKWRQNWNPWTSKIKVDVKKGEQHRLKIEWISEGGYLAVKHLDPFPKAEQNKLSLWSEVANEIDYYFIKGKNTDDVIRGYRRLTGKAPIVPKWALGYWQSRERYKTQDELLGIVKEYRRRKIPLDNIVLDWQYWEDPKWGSHEFDATRFPNPKGMIEQLHRELGANLMISVWPKFNKGTAHYEEMNKNGFLFTRNIEMKRKDWVGPGYESTFYNPFKPEAGALFWKQIDTKLNSLGIDAWWLDATEPDMHSNISIAERVKNMNPTGLGPAEKYFNAYSLQNSKSVYEGQRKSSPEKRVFILTRSAYAGQQRYGAATWSGDIVSRWSDFRDQIATGINFSMSGIPYWTMDIGGFAVEKRYEHAQGETLREWRELNTRWFQFGAFCPLFRSHGQFPFREIFNLAPEGSAEYASMVYYTKLRYRLLPYIYSMAAKSYFDDYTIMRGLVMDFPEDRTAQLVADQYMFGPSIMVAPVYEYNARKRDVYFPVGTNWFDFYSGKKYYGGQKQAVDAPLDRMPLFVKEGSIVLSGPVIQHTSEKQDPLTIYIFPGKNASIELYEDEGTNYNYELGKFATVPITYDEATRNLSIWKREGHYPGMPEKRKFEIVWVGDRPGGVDLTARPHQVIEYSGDPISVDFTQTK